MKLRTFFHFTPAAVCTSALIAIYAYVNIGCASSFKLISGGKSKAIRVLMSVAVLHDFNQWYKGADAATLSQNGSAMVTYTDNTDSIPDYLLQTDVLYLKNNQLVKIMSSHPAIFNFVNARHGLIIAHAELWYNFKHWPEYNLQLISG